MPRKKLENVVEDIVEDMDNDRIQSTPTRFDKVISTGSTLLDLAISGTKVRGGGVPGGILLEIFGPASAGKTALLAEIAGNVEASGGEVMFQDAEGRLPADYAQIYGLQLTDTNYYTPTLVSEMFSTIRKWEPENSEVINAVIGDSLAALCSKLDMEEEGDKRGQARAKEFSAETRKTCILLKQRNWLLACSNQERDSDYGKTTPGGNAIPYYASLRLRIFPPAQGKQLVTTKTINGVKHKKVYGICSEVQIKKSSIDVPFRTAKIYIVFNYGIDDIRGNLMYLKEATGSAKYDAITAEYSHINDAITYIEKNDLADDLKNKVIDTWEEIEKAFIFDRKLRH